VGLGRRDVATDQALRQPECRMMDRDCRARISGQRGRAARCSASRAAQSLCRRANL